MTTREKFKRTVIELIHDLPYEEAIRKELKIPGCFVEVSAENEDENYEIIHSGFKEIGIVTKSKLLQPFQEEAHNSQISCTDILVEEIQEGYEEDEFMWYFKINGAPITIGRVLLAFFYAHRNIVINKYGEIMDMQTRKIVATWSLEVNGKKDPTDDEQDDETIEALLQLLEDSISEYENSK
jgi:hypothetical protein